MHQSYVISILISFFTFSLAFATSVNEPTDHFNTLVDQQTPPVWLSAPYPNPAKKFTSIEYQLPAGTFYAEVRIYNLIGKEIQTQKITEPSGKLTLGTQNLKAGVYVIYLVIDDKPLTSRKLIVS